MRLGVFMRILTVSDYVEPLLYDRFDAARLPTVDLVLSCGDVPPEYLSFLTAVLNVPLYYVRGNHDIRHISKSPDGCTNLNGKINQYMGLNILGLEGSRWYNGGPFQYTENQMRNKIRRLQFKIWLKGGIDIIVTHAPPRHIFDAEDPCHRGFKSFRWLIRHYSPAYFIHGHIHRNFTNASERVSMVNNTKVINTYGYNLIEVTHEQMAK
jgi:Icc-related predicted phosphoesterase